MSIASKGLRALLYVYSFNTDIFLNIFMHIGSFNIMLLIQVHLPNELNSTSYVSFLAHNSFDFFYLFLVCADPFEYRRSQGS